jgi:hypothetical protein
LVAVTALLAGIQVMNRPDPAKLAAEDAAFRACIERYNAAQKAAFEKAKDPRFPGIEYFAVDPYKEPYDLATGKGCGEASRSH